MKITEKLLKFKFHILIVAALSLVVVSLLYLAPRFLNVLAYFWPLYLSTALFLVAVVVFGRTSPSSAGEKAGEGILDYVAATGQHEPEVQAAQVRQPEPVEQPEASHEPDDDEQM